MATNERDSGSTGAFQSIGTVTQTSSADLNDAFSVDKKLDGLVQSVEQKKQAVSSQSQELAALEAKLRETEQRLKEEQSSPAAKRKDDTGHEQQSLPGTYESASHGSHAAPDTHPVEKPLQASADQAPSTSTMSYWRPQMPGALPETPSDSRQNSYLGGDENNT